MRLNGSCSESLWFTTENRLAEGSVCNVFIVHEGDHRHAAIGYACLAGDRAKAVVELSGDNGINIGRASDRHRNIARRQEVFLTGSVLEIMPVTSIEKHLVGESVPGEVTKRMAILYKDLVARECGG